ncbi:hypothetical protein GCM10007857_67180 [Bradyrhizobium iriomotense]|uniref:Transposase n=1 Tax=Bradyrhizobium iriomotense TaxID=441950 RepID=A0ABQ6B999_9BRAD|nr:hypothetical protein GCM10007857_67180 [Bradyrhizobium iriomotense]
MVEHFFHHFSRGLEAVYHDGFSLRVPRDQHFSLRHLADEWKYRDAPVRSVRSAQSDDVAQEVSVTRFQITAATAVAAAYNPQPRKTC